MCVSCITYLLILIFFSPRFLVLLSLRFACLSPNSEHLPLYCALIGRKRLLVRISSVFFLFSSFRLCGSSHRTECSVSTAMRVQCTVCVCVCVSGLPVAPWYELVRCTHFTIAVCTHARTHSLPGVENSPSVSYIKADKCDVGVTFELAFVEQTTPWVYWKIKKNSKIEKKKKKQFLYFHFTSVSK